MTSRDTILAAIAVNKPSPVSMPVINIVRENDDSSTEQFVNSLTRAGAQAFVVASINEVAAIYLQSEEEDKKRINTIPELGSVNIAGIKDADALELQTVYQSWIRGAVGVIENGAIWLNESSVINRLLPFICEHLIIVQDAEHLVSNMHQAYSKIEIGKEGYGVFIAGPSKTADIEQSLVIGAHGAEPGSIYN